MYKALCIASLLVATLAVVGRNSSAALTPNVHFPVIVAKGRLVNQTTQIPATTILTPNEDGIYRLSVYATITKPDQSSASQWYVNASWTDDSGPQAATLEAGYANLSGQFGTYNFFFGPSGGGPSAAFEAKASTPISYSISQFGEPDESAYSLYYTLERLQ